MRKKQAVVLRKFGGPDKLRLEETVAPDLGPKQVRIAVKSAGVNFADLMMRQGLYPEAPPLPFTPGYEVAGVVTETGPEVTRVAEGDRVCAGTRFGGYSSEVVLHELQVRRVPQGLKDAEAASIPVNFMTAWMALDAMARVRAGDRVLIHSAAGGVGTAAVQLATLAGAEVTGLVGSAAKADAVKRLGASQVILREEWQRGRPVVGARFDVILDPTGGASVKRSLAHLRAGGRVVCYGMGSMVGGERRSLIRVARTMIGMPIFTPLKFMMSNTGLFGLNLLQLFPKEAELDTSTRVEPPLLFRAFDAVMELFTNGKLRALVSREYPLAEAGAAQEFLRSGTSIGKVILNVL